MKLSVRHLMDKGAPAAAIVSASRVLATFKLPHHGGLNITSFER
jgi:hypothetical protein